MKKLFLVLFVFALASCASVPEQASPQAIADWEKWKADENAAWSTKEFAILKIDDAVYLREGESAWLTKRQQKAPSYRWKLGSPRGGGHFVITYAGGKAKVHYGRKRSEHDLGTTQTINIRKGIDVRFARTQISPGVNGLRVVVYNQAHPAARHFEGLVHFPYDPTAVVEARVQAAPSAEPVDFQTSRGWQKRFNRVGIASFRLKGKYMKLSLYSDDTDPAKIKSVSAFFLDELSGGETYGVGRYFDIDVKGLPSTLTIDFNRAYNPNCARSPHYNCPVATEKLPVELRAGEMSPPKH